MGWLLILLAVVLLEGPLRNWAGRHWALLLSATVGAVFGYVVGSILTAMSPTMPCFTPLLGAVVCGIDAALAGPAWLRHIEKDGRNGDASGRH